MIYKQVLHSGTEYRGRVGAPMKMPTKAKPLPRVRCRHPFRLVGGPYDKKNLKVDGTSDFNTLVFTAHGQTGSYRGGKWVPQTL